MKKIVTWPDLSATLQIQYICPSEQTLRRHAAFLERELCTRLRQERTDLVHRATAEVVQAAMSAHWSIENVLSQRLDVVEIIAATNDACSAQRPVNLRRSSRRRFEGDAIVEWKASRKGLEVVATEVLLHGYVCVREALAGLPDDQKSLVELTSGDVAAVMLFGLAVHEMLPVQMNLTGWSDEMRMPSVQRARQRLLEIGQESSGSLTSPQRSPHEHESKSSDHRRQRHPHVSSA